MSECKANNKQEAQTNTDSCTNMRKSAINKQDANIQRQQDTPINTIIYFTSSSNTDAEQRKSSEMMQIIHDKFGDVFNGIGCFEGTFSLQLKPDSRPYQAPHRCVSYVLQKPFKEELKQLQKMNIITPLGVDKTAELCNSFVLVPKANSKVRLCLDPA